MDVDAGDPDGVCKKVRNFPAVDGVDTGKEEKGERESKSLLAANGKAEAPKRQRSGKRKVQWNDRHGNKLVEVLEFIPSISFKAIKLS